MITTGDRAATGQDGAERVGERRDPAHRSVAEWTTLIVSALIVAALIGTALAEHFWVDTTPGVALAVTLEMDQTRRVDNRYYVPFTVKNTGSEGAENVTIAFAVQRGDQTVEESTTQISFISNGGTANGELVTAFDPARYDITARVSTFETP